MCDFKPGQIVESIKSCLMLILSQDKHTKQYNIIFLLDNQFVQQIYQFSLFPKFDKVII